VPYLKEIPWITAENEKLAGKSNAVKLCTVVIETPVAVKPEILQAEAT
jgi:hypothetical protein